MWESGDRFQGIKDAEVALLGSDVRRDSREVDRLLHSDFVEIGRSGRRWTRGEIVVALLAEEESSPDSHPPKAQTTPTVCAFTHRVCCTAILARVCPEFGASLSNVGVGSVGFGGSGQ